MNKKIFSKEMFFEGIRQVRVIGVTGLIFMLIASFSSVMWIYYDSYPFFTSQWFVSAHTMYDINPFIFIPMLTAAPVMILVLFGFMNKRNASDFFHGIPCTRLCLFTSFCGACIFWNLIMIAGGTLCTVITVQCLRNVHIVLDCVLISMFQAFSGAVLVTFALAFAMTITGTYFTNIASAAILLFAPRGFISVFAMMLKNALPFVPMDSNNVLLNSSYNVLYGIANAVFGTNSSMLDSAGPVFYTLILALVYAVAGAICFIKRKSENATKASVNRGLQCLFRVVLALLISLIPIGIIFNIHSGSEDYNSGALFYIIIAYVTAAGAYFFYELITTKKLINLLKAIPGLFIVIAINFIFIFALNTSYDRAIQATPDAGEIEYVKIYGENDNLFWRKTEDVKMYSEEVRTVVSSSLKDTIRKWTNQRYGINGYYSSYYEAVVFTVEIHYNNETITREIIIDNAHYEQLKNALAKEEEFTTAFCDISVEKDIIKESMNWNNIDEKYHNDIYSTFIEELGKSSFETFFDMVNLPLNESYLFSISLYRNQDNKYYDAFVRVGANLPKTAAIYINGVNKSAAGDPVDLYINEVENLKEKFEKDGSSGYMDTSLDINIYQIDQNGKISQNNQYIFSYTDGNTGVYSSEEKLNVLREAQLLLEENRDEFKTEDFCAGTQLLLITYSNYREESTASYENGDFYSESVALCNMYEEKWYVANEEIIELIREAYNEQDIYID